MPTLALEVNKPDWGSLGYMLNYKEDQVAKYMLLTIAFTTTYEPFSLH